MKFKKPSPSIKPKPDRPSEDPDKLWVYGTLHRETREPVLIMEWRKESTVLSVNEARKHAADVWQVAESIESDGFLVYVLGKLDFTYDEAMAILLDFRFWRTQPQTKRTLLSIPPLPPKSTSDEARAYASKLLVMAETADAQAFLIGFLTGRMRLDDDTAGKLAQEYADYYQQRRKVGAPPVGKETVQ